MKQEKFSESLQILQELLTALNQSVDSFSLRASIVNLIAECYFRQDKFIMLLESIKLLETPEFSALDKQLQIELLSKKGTLHASSQIPSSPLSNLSICLPFTFSSLNRSFLPIEANPLSGGKLTAIHHCRCRPCANIYLTLGREISVVVVVVI